jgi:hypothetical protein
VRYIVRVETGVINRSIHQLAILDDPNEAGPDLKNHADRGWNNRLIYMFGGGCGGGHYRQGSSTRRAACSTTACCRAGSPSRPAR